MHSPRQWMFKSWGSEINTSTDIVNIWIKETVVINKPIKVLIDMTYLWDSISNKILISKSDY